VGLGAIPTGFGSSVFFCRAGSVRFVIGLIQSVSRMAYPSRPPCVVAATAVEMSVPDPALDHGLKPHQTDFLAARTKGVVHRPNKGSLVIRVFRIKVSRSRRAVESLNLHTSACRVTRWHGTSCSAARRSSLDRPLPLADNP